MSLFLGPQQDGPRALLQDTLLWVSFLMQDVGEWLRNHGRRFEDWVCPSGRRAVQEPLREYWKEP